MSFTENGGNGNGLIMPVAPMYAGYGGGNGNNDGIGDGWWIILLLLAMNGWGNNNGWGGNSGGGNGGFPMFPYFTAQNTDAGVQRGFDTASLTNQLSNIQNTLADGFAQAEVSSCNKAMNQMQSMYDTQIASMNQRFADTLNLQGGLNNINQSLNNCCCENRAGLADLKYTVATEACADRSAVNDALRDVLTAMTASNQRILDQMCQDKIDAKNDTIAQLRQQLYMKDLTASQLAQTGELRAGQNQAVDALYNRLATCPVGTMPVYGSQPIFTCPNNNNGCGCGCNGSF